MKKSKGIKKKTCKHRQVVRMVIMRGNVGWEEIEEGKSSINGDGRRLDFRW